MEGKKEEKYGRYLWFLTEIHIFPPFDLKFGK